MRPLRYPVVLASGSPRRKELLARLIPEFEVLPADVDEDGLTDSDPWVTAQRLAREKALTVFEQRPDTLVIGGDTVVALPVEDGFRQYAKPVDAADAERMLGELSGREHLVITGVALRWPKGLIAITETSKVTFRELSPEAIRYYVATGEPLDKAGAYGIQGMAATLVARLEGELENVIGLPVARLEELLRDVS